MFKKSLGLSLLVVANSSAASVNSIKCPPNPVIVCCNAVSDFVSKSKKAVTDFVVKHKEPVMAFVSQHQVALASIGTGVAVATAAVLIKKYNEYCDACKVLGAKKFFATVDEQVEDIERRANTTLEEDLFAVPNNVSYKLAEVGGAYECLNTRCESCSRELTEAQRVLMTHGELVVIDSYLEILATSKKAVQEKLAKLAEVPDYDEECRIKDLQRTVASLRSECASLRSQLLQAQMQALRCPAVYGRSY